MALATRAGAGLLVAKKYSSGPASDPRGDRYESAANVKNLRRSGGDRDAPQRAHHGTPRSGIETLDQIARHEVELLRPDRRGAAHRHHPAALADRARLGRDLITDDLRPQALHDRQRRGRLELGGQRPDRGRHGARGEAPHARTASCATAPSATASRTTALESAPGTCAR